VLPANQVQQLERLVAEVEHVAGVRVEALGGGVEDQLVQFGHAGPVLDRRQQGPLRRIALANGRPVAEPVVELLEGHLVGLQRVAVAARGHPRRVGRHPARSLVEGQVGRFLAEVRDQVGHRGQDRHSTGPAVAILQPEQGHLSNNLAVVDSRMEEADDRLRLDEAQVLLHPLAQAAAEPFGRVSLPGQRRDVDLVVAHLDVVDRDVVREEVERAPAAEVEARVVPVAGQDPVLDGSAVQRKPHVRAAVVHGRHLAVVRVDGDRSVRAANHHHSPPPQLRQRRNVDPLRPAGGRGALAGRGTGRDGHA
jgi:hypothetical protein